MKKLFALIFIISYKTSSYSQIIIPDQLNPRTSIELNGQLQLIDAGSNNRNISNEVTVEAWVRTKATHPQWLVGKQSNTEGFKLSIQNNRAIFCGANSLVNNSGLSSTVINDDKWHHLTGVFRGGNWEIWVDGNLENSSLSNGSTILTSNFPLIIGLNKLDSSEYFQGYIGEIKLWNRARTENQIRTFMAQVIKSTLPELVCYFRCDIYVNAPLSNGKLKDLSNLQFHGQLNSGFFKFTNNAPPIGDESHFYYGKDLNNQTFKIFSAKGDTITINGFLGNAKGFHLYKNNIAPITNGHMPPKSIEFLHYYGMLACGDTNATFEVTYTQDTTLLNKYFILYTRTDSRKSFFKIRPGLYNAALDAIRNYTVKDRGEVAFVYPCQVGIRVLSDITVGQCPEYRPTTLTASKGLFYFWNNGETTKSIQVNQTGKYWVNLGDYCGQFGTDTFRVEIAPPVKLPTLQTSDTIICDNASLKLSLPKGYLYQWPDGSIADTFAISTAGTYSVTVTDPRCGNSQSSAIRVKTVACGPEKVFIPNIITPNNDGLNDVFATIGLPAAQWGLTIFNRWGKQVFQSYNYQNDWNAQGLSAGIYYYYFQSAKSTHTFKGFVEVIR